MRTIAGGAPTCASIAEIIGVLGWADAAAAADSIQDARRIVDAPIATKRPGDYAAAVALLKDLRDVSARKGTAMSSCRRSTYYVRRARRSRASSRV